MPGIERLPLCSDCGSAFDVILTSLAGGYVLSITDFGKSLLHIDGDGPNAQRHVVLAFRGLFSVSGSNDCVFFAMSILGS
jgi:hypothetical protein